MAGEYLEMDHDLTEKPAMLKLRQAMPEVAMNRIMGSLFLFWRYVDRHCNGPALRGVTLPLLCNVAGETPEFWQTVAEKTGWLKIRKNGKLEVGDWEKRFSNSAKVRSATRRRKRLYDARQRALREKSNGPVTQNVTRTRPRACAAVRTEPNRTVYTSIDRPIEGTIFEQIDWEQACEAANGHLSELRRLNIRLTKPNRRMLLQTLAIVQGGVLPETWLTDALEAAGEGPEKQKPAAYLCTCLTNGAKDRGVDFPALRRRIKVPVEMLQRGKQEETAT